MEAEKGALVIEWQAEQAKEVCRVLKSEQRGRLRGGGGQGINEADIC